MRTLAIAIALVAASPTVVSAAFEMPIQVFQPVVTYEGIFIEPVIFAPYIGTSHAMAALDFTCAENRLYTSRGFENRNIASRLGMTAHVRCNPDAPSWSCLYGDTLNIVVEAPLSPRDSTFSDVSPDTALVATLECLAANAAKILEANYVTFVIEGDPAFARYGTTWRLEPFRAGPRRWEF